MQNGLRMDLSYARFGYPEDFAGFLHCQFFQIVERNNQTFLFRQLFDRLLNLTKTTDGQVGCFMCNTAVELAPSDAEAAAKVQAHMKLLRDAFLSKLSEGQNAGELAEGKDIGALAEFLATTAYSVGFLLRSGCSVDYVRRHVRTALTAVE